MGEMTDRWQDRLEDAFQAREPFLGHPMLPIPLRDTKARTERISTYVEYDFYKFMQEYEARGGFRGLSEVLRRLAILGAIAEGYKFDLDQDRSKESGT